MSLRRQSRPTPKRAPLLRGFGAKGAHRSALTAAKHAFEEQWPTYLTLEATDSLCRAAGELAEKYSLRGFDSIHLASSPRWLVELGLTTRGSPASMNT